MAVFFGAAGFDSNRPARLKVGRFSSFFGSGVAGVLGGWAFAAGVESVDSVNAAGLLSNKPAKLKVGRPLDLTGSAGGATLGF